MRAAIAAFLLKLGIGLSTFGANIWAYVIQFFVKKLWGAAVEKYEQWKRADRQAEQRKKHEETMKKGDATDEENAKSFEDTFNRD